MRAITLDLHSTLVFYDVDDVQARHEVAHRVLSSHLSLPSLDEFTSISLSVRTELLSVADRDLAEVTVSDRLALTLARIGYPSLDPALLAATTAAYMDHWIGGLRAPDGLAADLERLHESYRLGLITNFGDGPAIPRILERFGISGVFDTVVVSADCGVRKPHPKIFRIALESLDCPPGETIHVGDDLAADVEGARAVGVFPVLLDAAGFHESYSGARVKSVADLALLVSLPPRS